MRQTHVSPTIRAHFFHQFGCPLDKMSHLKAIIEFSIELHKFVNVDLFQRGFYQIRLTHKVPSKIIHKIEVNYNKFSMSSSSDRTKDEQTSTTETVNSSSSGISSSGSTNNNGPIVFPACIVNGSAVSKTFQILYKNEEIPLNDVVSFKTHVILDASRCIDQVKRINFSLIVELWFTEEDFGPQQHNSIQCVSSRTLRMNVDMCRGLHYHLPVFFDYFHLSAITMSIHASLTTLCQPYLKNPRPRPKTSTGIADDGLSNDPSGYDYLLFGCSLSSLKDLDWDEMQVRMRRAQLVHWQLCSIVFTLMQSMERKLYEYRLLIADHRHQQRSRSSSRHSKRGHTHYTNTTTTEDQSNTSSKSSSWKNRHHSLSSSSSSTSLFGLTEIKPNQRSMSMLAQSCYKSTMEGNKDRTKDFIAYQNKTHHHQSQSHSSPSSSSQSPCISPNQIQPGNYITLVESDLAYLSGLSILLWEQLIETVIHSDVVAQYLSRIHHHRRVKRFSEGFFIIERDRDSIVTSICDVNHTAIYNEITENIRKSAYFYLLTTCDVECLTLDGDVSSLPIIFQDVYDPMFSSRHQHQSHQPNLNIYHQHSHQLEEQQQLIQHYLDVGYVPKSDTTSNKNKFQHKSNKPKVSCLSPPPAMTSSSRSPSSSPKSPKNTVRFSFGVQEINNTSDKSRSSTSLKPHNYSHRRSRSKSPTPTCSQNTSDIQLHQRRRQSSPRGSKMTASVTLSDWKEFSAKQQELSKKSKPESSSVSGKSSESSTSKKNMSFSQSVPDLTTCQSTTMMSQRPKRRAKSTIDHNKNLRKDKYRITNPSTSTTSSTNVSDMFTGTTYFPKPPPEFIGGENPTPSNATDETSGLSVTSSRNQNDECHRKSPMVGHETKNDDDVDFLTKDLEQISVSFSKSSIDGKVVTHTRHDHQHRSQHNHTSSSDIDDILSTHSCLVCEIGKKCSCNTASLLLIEREQDHYHSTFFTPSSVTSPVSLRKKELTSSLLSSETPTTPTSTFHRTSRISSRLVSFLEAKEEFRREKAKGWNVYSDFNRLASTTPYFDANNESMSLSSYQMLHHCRPVHLVVCVHGLDGNSGDLRLVKTYLELGLPHVNFDFLMSQRNQGETFDSIETLTNRLVREILYYIEVYQLNPDRISFIGHSLGNIIIRAALAHPDMKLWLNRLHTFLSLSGPHLGTAYNPSGLVNMGLWVFQKWKKSASLLQLAMKDNVDIRQCYLYKLSLDRGLEYFRYVLLFGSSQDNYVPIHSAHIELCSAALNDSSSNGLAYREMVSNLLEPIVKSESCKLSRFDVHHALSSSSANSIIGRAAHIAVLDSELFIEKLWSFVVCSTLRNCGHESC